MNQNEETERVEQARRDVREVIASCEEAARRLDPQGRDGEEESATEFSRPAS